MSKAHKPKFEIEQEELEAIGVASCSCGARVRVPMRRLRAGSVIALPCGESEVTLSGQVEDVQRSLDDVKEAVGDLGKTFDRISKRRH